MTFPLHPHVVFFLTKIYHPNVDINTGAICVNTLKKDWNPSMSFGHVLSVVRCLLIVPFPESSLNDEAGKLFMESYEEYSRRARLMTNVHGRPKAFDFMHLGMEKNLVNLKNSKENENKNTPPKCHSISSTSSGTILKQSNSSVGLTQNVNGKLLTSKNLSTGKNSKQIDRKNKKKSLKRL